MNIDSPKKIAVRKPVVIGLVLAHAYSYDRQILQGIMRFATTRPHWRFVSTKRAGGLTPPVWQTAGVNPAARGA